MIDLNFHLEKQKLVCLEVDKENDKNIINIMKNEFDNKFNQYKKITEK